MNFISEKEINQNKNINNVSQEAVDNRPLYHRLKEVKDKKQLEYEESHKLKNHFRGIDEDESDFLEMINNSKNQAERQRKLEEDELIKQTLKMKSTTSPESSSIIPIKPIRNENSTKPKPSKQSSLISLGIRKRQLNVKNSDETSPSQTISSKSDENDTLENNKKLNEPTPKKFVTKSLNCLIGVLPSLVNYNDSSSNEDSDSSDSSSDEGHKVLYLEKVQRASEEETCSNNKYA